MDIKVKNFVGNKNRVTKYESPEAIRKKKKVGGENRQQLQKTGLAEDQWVQER